MRPLSLIRPSAWPVQRPAAADSGLAGAGRGGPHRMSEATAGPAGPAVACWSPWQGGSGGGERVVAELGQDVMGLAEDLAGLGQAGALAVLAVLHLGVVAVVRGGGAGVGLARLVEGPAQHRRSLPGQPPGR